MDMVETDVLVAGGGVAGLVATAVFTAAGFSVACADPQPPVTAEDDDGADLRSTAFLEPAIELLDEAGIWPRLAPHATDLVTMRIADADAGAIRECQDFTAAELGRPRFGANLPNWLIRRELVAHIGSLGNARLLAPASVTAVTPRLREARVRMTGAPPLRARLVIAADGRDSSLREAAGIGTRRWRFGQKALVFAVTHALPHNGVSTEIHASGGPFTLVPLPDQGGSHRSAVVWMEDGPEALRLADLDPGAFNDALAARACGAVGAIALQGRRALWPIVSQIARRMDAPRIALIAEAAHVVPPIGAQGLNMSLADIRALRDLAAGARDAGEDIASPALLARYHLARHPEVLARVLGVGLLNRASQAGARPLRDLRASGIRLLGRTAPLRQAAMRAGLGL